MYKILPTRSFESDAKVLLKKYASLHEELSKLTKELSLNPTKGTPIGNIASKYDKQLKVRAKEKVEEQELLLM